MHRRTRSSSDPSSRRLAAETETCAAVAGVRPGKVRPWPRAGITVVGLVCTGLLGGVVSPVWAGEADSGGGGSAAVGAFALGDGLEAAVDERDGSVRFNLLAGGLALTWDSKAAGGGDRSGFGPGWGLGLAHVGTVGGVQVFPASGGSYEPDASHPSGLAAYGVEDVRFDQEPGVLPGRDVDPVVGLPGPIPEVRFRYVLHELGGAATYFNEAGDPVVRTTAAGERTDWSWDPSTPHRLRGTVNPDGIITTLDWESGGPGTILVTQGANLPGEIDPVTGEVGPVPVWTVDLDGGRVAAVVDPLGGRTVVGYDRVTGLVSALSGGSGSTTRIDWRAFDDGTLRAERVQATDQDGRELSVREWAPGGDGTPSSGWPAYNDEGELFWSHDAAASYSSVLSDGATRVVSTYNSQHRIIDRSMVVTTTGGEATIQQQRFTYPGTEGGELPDPAALPANWSRPTSTVIAHRDPQGNERTETQLAEFDALGREISRTTPDGTVTTTEYDPVVPESGVLPVGLPIVERVSAADGLVQETRYTPDDTRAAVIRTETFAGRADDGLTRTGLAEFELTPEGIVAAKKSYPSGDAAAVPVVARWDQVVNLEAGTLTGTETLAAGTSAATTTTTVSSLRHGGVLAATDAVGNTTRTGHDALGRPIRAIDTAGNVATSVIETYRQHARNATTTTGPDGVVATEIRDALGRVERLTDNIDHGTAVAGFTRIVETRSYPEPGLVTVANAWGATTTAHYDGVGRTTRATGPTGLTEVTEYDDVARTVTTGLTPTGSLEDAETIATEMRDERGRPAVATGERRDGIPVPEIRAGYDGLGRATTASTDALDTEIRYDAFGDAVETTMMPVDEVSAGLTAARRFDGFGTSLEKTLSGADEQRSGGARVLDELGRTVRETDQLDRATLYEYTPDGLVSKVSADHGATTEHAYDPSTRALVETTVTSPLGPTVRTGYEHDPVTGEVLAIFDPADRPATEISYTYDAHRNPLTTTYPDGKQISHAYDEHGRRISTTDVAGNVTDFTFTPEGLLTNAAQRDADGASLSEVSYEHDEFSRVRSLTRGNGVTTEYRFTSASQVASEITADRDGHVLSDRSYTYDARGNLTQRVDLTHDRGDDEQTTTTTYGYDAFDQLITSTVHDGDATGSVERQTEYELTVSGDIQTETTTMHPGAELQSSTVRAFEYSPRGELVGRTSTTRTGRDPGAEEVVRQAQEYDTAGNLIVSFDGGRHSYDAANRPVTEASADGSTLRTAYWADGARREVATADVGGEPTAGIRYYWDGASLLNEIHTAGVADDGAPPAAVEPDRAGVAAYLVGVGRHGRSTVDEAGVVSTWYLGADRHGNVTELIDADGAAAARYAYTDYGVRTVHTDDPGIDDGLRRNPFGFAGEYTDAAGTQYLRSRIYDPEDHRFTTQDAAPLHNLYAFSDLNPITNFDPSGRNAEPDWASIANWVTFGLGLALTLVGMASIATMVRTTRAAWAIAQTALSPTINGTARKIAVSGWDWFAITVGLGFDLGSTFTAGALVYNDTIDTFSSDEQLMNDLMWVDMGLAIGAAFTGAFAARTILRRTQFANLQLDMTVQDGQVARLADSLIGGGGAPVKGGLLPEIHMSSSAPHTRRSSSVADTSPPSPPPSLPGSRKNSVAAPVKPPAELLPRPRSSSTSSFDFQKLQYEAPVRTSRSPKAVVGDFNRACLEAMKCVAPQSDAHSSLVTLQAEASRVLTIADPSQIPPTLQSMSTRLKIVESGLGDATRADKLWGLWGELSIATQRAKR